MFYRFIFMFPYQLNSFGNCERSEQLLVSQTLNQSMSLESLAKNNIHKAAITQLVECLAVNQDVTGSSPVGGVYASAGGL